MEDNEVSEVNDYISELPKLVHQAQGETSPSASLEDDPKSVKKAAQGSEIASEFHLGNANVILSTKNIVKEKRIFTQPLEDRFKSTVASKTQLDAAWAKQE